MEQKHLNIEQSTSLQCTGCENDGLHVIKRWRGGLSIIVYLHRTRRELHRDIVLISLAIPVNLQLFYFYCRIMDGTFRIAPDLWGP